MNNLQVLQKITKEIKSYLKENPSIKSFVIGVSGGIDSAICCALANYALRGTDVKLVGRCISITTSADEIERADMIGRAFCDSYKRVNFTSTFEDLNYDLNHEDGHDEVEWGLVSADEVSKTGKIRAGNIKARLRMTYLYHLASSYQGLVLSTDNWTEYLLGFWTLHGDVGDLGMIQELWKGEVFELSEYIAKKSSSFNSEQKAAMLSCVQADPTDGLGISGTDLDQIIPGWEKQFPTSREGYEYVDELLKMITYHDLKVKAFDQSFLESVKRRHYNTEYKRNNPFNFSRETIYSE